jgi:hypothetical protein
MSTRLRRDAVGSSHVMFFGSLFAAALESSPIVWLHDLVRRQVPV